MSNVTSQFSLTGVKIFWFAFYAFLIISTVLGNVLVCVVILKNRNLRTPSNYFLVNMSFSDMLICLFSIPMSMIFLSHHETWSFGEHLNIAADSIWFGFTLLAFINITLIACERYIAITRPYSYETIITKPRSVFCCCCAWLYMAVLIFGLVQFTFRTPKETYTFLIPGYVYYIVLYSHVTIAFTVVPFLYYKIFLVAKIHKLKICRQTRWKRQKYFYLQMKAVRTIFLVTLLFVIVWLPFLVKQWFALDDIFDGNWSINNSITTSITYCNGAANFFVYYFRDAMIRQTLIKIFKCKNLVLSGSNRQACSEI
ncbi:adrenocorticotropic hormone receptor-like [Dendronephthya gigantea]|uniref:adrenocorticotropic hormone receptor-like n=1 Tax=Dendronephthya gigantea TaxID=151771 RepID=UPI00106C0DB0|nr:adrenocorticotropic hormone receptor-like [Dendronephthya gigantea]